MTDTLCLFCGKPIDTRQRTGWMRKIIGWEEVRSRGGANKIVRREPTGGAAHSICVESGMLPGQQELL